MRGLGLHVVKELHRGCNCIIVQQVHQVIKQAVAGYNVHLHPSLPQKRQNKLYSIRAHRVHCCEENRGSIDVTRYTQCLHLLDDTRNGLQVLRPARVLDEDVVRRHIWLSWFGRLHAFENQPRLSDLGLLDEPFEDCVADRHHGGASDELWLLADVLVKGLEDVESVL